MSVKYQTLYKCIETAGIFLISFVGDVSESCQSSE